MLSRRDLLFRAIAAPAAATMTACTPNPVLASVAPRPYKTGTQGEAADFEHGRVKHRLWELALHAAKAVSMLGCPRLAGLRVPLRRDCGLAPGDTVMVDGELLSLTRHWIASFEFTSERWLEDAYMMARAGQCGVRLGARLGRDIDILAAPRVIAFAPACLPLPGTGAIGARAEAGGVQLGAILSVNPATLMNELAFTVLCGVP